MDTSSWTAFDQNQSAFDYSESALKAKWNELHNGDREPFPADAALASAWQAYHRGDFAAAVNQASTLADEGHVVINKASGIYADYLEDDDAVKKAIYRAGIERAEAAIAFDPDNVNAHYFHAFHLGRYSQTISITQALSQGLGGKIQTSLKRVLALDPEHAEAHTAIGLYHAEIISKVGKLVGSMTYGASTDQAFEHFERAIELSNAPIAWIEYGNGLYLIHGDKKADESNDAYLKAAEMEPIDAMQALDIAYARNSIE
ncbi:MAG: hypothetical protein AAGH65_04800 [Pseudomonadota bacterium]